MASKGDLQRLNARLNRIETEENVVDPTVNKFVCAECGKSFHRIGLLVVHYTRLHTQAGLVCFFPDCGLPFSTQKSLLEHRNMKHRGHEFCPYPGCEKRCKSWTGLTQHLLHHSTAAEKQGYHFCFDCGGAEIFPDLIRLTQHAYQAHPGVSVASSCLECHQRFPTDLELCQHYRTTHPFPHSVELICPAPNCSQSFSSADDLYLHYRNSRHPSYIPNQEPRHLAFKCPFGFCARAYSSQIGLGIHNALAHGSEIGGLAVFSLPSANLAKERDSDHPESSNDGDDVESVVEIDEQGAVFLPDELSNNVEPDEMGDPSPQSHKLRIGFILDDHPSFDESEEAVRDQHDRGSPSDHGHYETDFPDETLARDILQQILLLLQADEKVSFDELLELWTVFLQPCRRQYIIGQLEKLDIFEESETLVARLRGSALGGVIFAWIRFKSLLDQAPAHLQNTEGRLIPSSGRDTACAILMHCMLLENLRARAPPTVLRMGFGGIPDRLRVPSSCYDVSGPDATFAQILDALVERVKCRKALPEQTAVTNEIILAEIPKYLAELKEAVWALYPGSHDNEEWLNVFGSDLID